MKNELRKASDNPWLEYGNAITARSIIGDLLKFGKGDFLAGMENREIRLGTKFTAVMDSLMAGYQHWWNATPGEQRMGPVAKGYVPCKRKELGDTDEKEWEVDDDGRPRDPWQFTNYLVLVQMDEGQIYTFATSSRGGLGAVGELCKTFGKHVRQHPDEYPIIELGVGSYQHRNKSFGRIKYPIFKIVGWIDKKGPLALLAANGGNDGDSTAELPLDYESIEAAAAAAKPSAKKTVPAEPKF
jgi:hypothetical protein